MMTPFLLGALLAAAVVTILVRLVRAERASVDAQRRARDAYVTTGQPVPGWGPLWAWGAPGGDRPGLAVVPDDDVDDEPASEPDVVIDLTA